MIRIEFVKVVTLFSCLFCVSVIPRRHFARKKFSVSISVTFGY